MDIKEYQKAVGENIRMARWASEMTQEEAAAAGKISYRYYRDVEHGRRNVSIGQLYVIAQIFNVPMGYLTDLDPEASRKARKKILASKPKAPPKGRRAK